MRIWECIFIESADDFTILNQSRPHQAGNILKRLNLSVYY